MFVLQKEFMSVIYICDNLSQKSKRLAKKKIVRHSKGEGVCYLQSQMIS